MNNEKLTWKEAFLSGPGPVTKKQAFWLFLKGLFMGTADIIPGVSGGTIALITGIYKDLILAIKSANTSFFKHIISLNLKTAIWELHTTFLISLFSGICIALISLAHITNYMLVTHPEKTWALFFGLILASIYIVSKKISRWMLPEMISVTLGVIAGFMIVGLIPVSTPDTYLFIFLSGMIAICAMILPGISGAFILLILGKYVYVTSALKNPFVLENSIIIAIFCLGCLIGLMSFSRLLSYLLDHYYDTTIAFLTGLMLGSVRKIWPWKEIIDQQEVHGKLNVIQEKAFIPDTLNSDLFIECGLILAGIIAVILMDRFARQNQKSL